MLMDETTFRDAVDALKKLAGMITLSAMEENDAGKLALGNGLSIALASYSIGGDMPLKLLMALGPLSKEIAKEVEKGTEGTGDLTAVDPRDIIGADGKVSAKEFVKNEIDLRNMLSQSGVTLSGLENGQGN